MSHVPWVFSGSFFDMGATRSAKEGSGSDQVARHCGKHCCARQLCSLKSLKPPQNLQPEHLEPKGLKWNSLRQCYCDPAPWNYIWLVYLQSCEQIHGGTKIQQIACTCEYSSTSSKPQCIKKTRDFVWKSFIITWWPSVFSPPLLLGAVIPRQWNGSWRLAAPPSTAKPLGNLRDLRSCWCFLLRQSSEKIWKHDGYTAASHVWWHRRVHKWLL